MTRPVTGCPFRPGHPPLAKTATASPVTSIPSTLPRTLQLCSGRAQGRLGSRRREYIGADPEAQPAALARVETYEKLVQVCSEIREVDHRLAAITGHLARALHAATNGFDPYW
ncbi:MAG: hypothetical protein E3J21_04715 [Anaerolineales bacterium]|nr:MAG: hypothetical protein E3J21_04715 [Anaerolineales bacterium]